MTGVSSIAMRQVVQNNMKPRPQQNEKLFQVTVLPTGYTKMPPKEVTEGASTSMYDVKMDRWFVARPSDDGNVTIDILKPNTFEKEEHFEVNVHDVNPANASCLELFALDQYHVSQGESEPLLSSFIFTLYENEDLHERANHIDELKSSAEDFFLCNPYKVAMENLRATNALVNWKPDRTRGAEVHRFLGEHDAENMRADNATYMHYALSGEIGNPEKLSCGFYKPADYSEDDPVYIVKFDPWDGGDEIIREIHLNDVNLSAADKYETFAYAIYLKEKGLIPNVDDMLTSWDHAAGIGSESNIRKVDVISAINEFMQAGLKQGYYQQYLDFRRLLDVIMK